MLQSFPEILQLSIPERILLVEEIWDSIAASHEDIPLTESQKLELDRRLELHVQNPTQGSPWGEVKERILQLR